MAENWLESGFNKVANSSDHCWMLRETWSSCGSCFSIFGCSTSLPTNNSNTAPFISETEWPILIEIQWQDQGRPHHNLPRITVPKIKSEPSPAMTSAHVYTIYPSLQDQRTRPRAVQHLPPEYPLYSPAQFLLRGRTWGLLNTKEEALQSLYSSALSSSYKCTLLNLTTFIVKSGEPPHRFWGRVFPCLSALRGCFLKTCVRAPKL